MKKHKKISNLAKSAVLLHAHQALSAVLLHSRVAQVGDLVQLDDTPINIYDKDGKHISTTSKCSPYHSFIHITTPGQLHVHRGHIARVIVRGYKNRCTITRT